MSTPKLAQFNVFLDSDGPIANFDKALQESGSDTEDFKFWPGVYLWLEVTPGAENALNLLKQLDDQNILRTWILTKTPSDSPYAYTEKVLWYRKNFPWLEDRVILTHDKSLLGTSTDFLLDDRPHKANADKFRGSFVYFDPTEPISSWVQFLELVETKVTLLAGRNCT